MKLNPFETAHYLWHTQQNVALLNLIIEENIQDISKRQVGIERGYLIYFILS